jgi:S1-C subfamily serine protease
MWRAVARRHNRLMTTNALAQLSDQMADAVAAAAPSVVQVHGRRRPISGVAYSNDIVVTTIRALGREDGLTVRNASGAEAAAELAGWDPATGLAVLKVSSLDLAPARLADGTARVGQIAIGIARSWSNALTASAGIVAVIGGPLRTGPGQSLDQVIRITAPMHEGFSGGAVVDANGGILGIGTAARIRGLGVVIPAATAWKSVAHVLEHGRPKTGFLGVVGQAITLPEGQRGGTDRDRGLLVSAVSANSPAAAAGLLVGDVILDLDGQPVGSTDRLLGLLSGDRVGRSVPVRVLRAGAVREVPVTVGQRPGARS